MTIDLTKPMENSRTTRVVIGRHSGMDISEIFETHQKDFITNEEITHENFDDDDVYYIQQLGFTKRKSILNCGFVRIENNNNNIYDEIHSRDIRTPNNYMPMINVADIIEKNGKTIKQNNMALKHKCPVGSLVEIIDDADGEYFGVRLYVVEHTRDCDGEPLYCLCANKNHTEVEKSGFRNNDWLSGLGEESLKIIRRPR